ncbi:MAG: hypothetical protein CVU96_01075 [Firmicutes bacterium HGW-Firmicutes-20]|jgi:hypothetical protein|nr:MAG: hypothetical protein CVU96_01075 [Firmicutes bacterium HGW-Firmicutes-20]PKM66889.1 MAG: hypothetical protein CVU94_06975 [Firmicutes bacterium HGW-Firmicutes-19]
MNASWLIHILFLIVLIILILFLRFNPQLGKWGRGFWVGLWLLNSFLYIRTVMARLFPAPGSWDDLVFGLFFVFTSYALLAAISSTWLYLLYKRKTK